MPNSRARKYDLAAVEYENGKSLWTIKDELQVQRVTLERALILRGCSIREPKRKHGAEHHLYRGGRRKAGERYAHRWVQLAIASGEFGPAVVIKATDSCVKVTPIHNQTECRSAA